MTLNLTPSLKKSCFKPERFGDYGSLVSLIPRKKIPFRWFWLPLIDYLDRGLIHIDTKKRSFNKEFIMMSCNIEHSKSAESGAWSKPGWLSEGILYFSEGLIYWLKMYLNLWKESKWVGNDLGKKENRPQCRAFWNFFHPLFHLGCCTL